MTSSSQDESILSGLRRGEAAAVREWYRQYQPKVKAWLKLKVDNGADVDELSQEVFLNCLRHLQLFRGDASLWGWMVSIARHEVADYYRKKYAKKAITALPLTELVPVNQVADAHEISDKVKTVFHQLSAEAQELLLLKYVDGKSVKDIAEELGKSAKAVESDLFRARRDFRYYFALGTTEL